MGNQKDLAGPNFAHKYIHFGKVGVKHITKK